MIRITLKDIRISNPTNYLPGCCHIDEAPRLRSLSPSAVSSGPNCYGAVRYAIFSSLQPLAKADHPCGKTSASSVESPQGILAKANKARALPRLKGREKIRVIIQNNLVLGKRIDGSINFTALIFVA
jgi:hypothetical protein